MQTNLSIASFVSLFLLISCNSNETTTTETSKDSAQTETANTTTNTATGDVRANIQLTVTGGDMAGSYTADCRDACCSWGIAGDKIFGNQYSETGKGEKELSSVQLVIEDVNSSGSKTTNEFMVTVSFGELFGANSKTFNINTTKGKSDGSGTATIDYSGNKATITIKGVSKGGPSIDLKMECLKVITSDNLLQ